MTPSLLILSMGGVTSYYSIDFVEEEYEVITVEEAQDNAASLVGRPIRAFDTLDSMILLNEWDKKRFPRPTELPPPIARVRFGKKAVNLYPGATAFLGGTGSGKTYLSQKVLTPQLQQALGVGFHQYVRFSEPEAPALGSISMLHDTIASAIAQQYKSLVLDSIRAFVYTGRGATGKGGMDMGIYNMITALSLLASEVNMMLGIVINPLSTAPDVVESYIHALEGSAHTIIHCKEPGKATYKTRGTGDRTGVELSFYGQDLSEKVDDEEPPINFKVTDVPLRTPKNLK